MNLSSIIEDVSLHVYVRMYVFYVFLCMYVFLWDLNDLSYNFSF